MKLSTTRNNTIRQFNNCLGYLRQLEPKSQKTGETSHKKSLNLVLGNRVRTKIIIPYRKNLKLDLIKNGFRL